METFTIYGHGLLYASVCTSLSDEAATERLNFVMPTGTQSAWAIDDEGVFADGTPNPQPCNLNAENRHILFSC
jgi:hypothetical protein